MERSVYQGGQFLTYFLPYNNLLLVSQVTIKPKARSTAFASAVKIVEPPGIRYICIYCLRP